MERSRRHRHYLLVFLLCTLAAVATVGTQLQAHTAASTSSSPWGETRNAYVMSMCHPASLAARLAGGCVPGFYNEQCCEAAAVAVGLGGHVPCLCRVAREPALLAAGLDIHFIITLYYITCGGLRPGGPHRADACGGYTDSGAFVQP